MRIPRRPSTVAAAAPMRIPRRPSTVTAAVPLLLVRILLLLRPCAATLASELAIKTTTSEFGKYSHSMYTSTVATFGDGSGNTLAPAFYNTLVHSVRIELNGVSQTWVLPSAIRDTYTLRTLMNAQADLPGLTSRPTRLAWLTG